jgi:indole-3-glycerol phosphate synthase
MNILDNIVAHKQIEVARKKILSPAKTLEVSAYFHRKTISLRQALCHPDGCGVIAEFKRKSPSKGMINSNATIAETTKGYHAAGASALSILTDSFFFGGSDEDLQEGRQNNFCPILRKDFIIDEYQVLEARAMGADAILLIAAILSKEKIKHLADLAFGLGMEVILEVHTKEELDSLNEHISVVGVNNRNLKTFITDSAQSLDLLPFIPSGYMKISESGISSPYIAFALKTAGFDGFLIGEQFMKQAIPEQACASFISTFKKMIYAG